MDFFSLIPISFTLSLADNLYIPPIFGADNFSVKYLQMSENLPFLKENIYWIKNILNCNKTYSHIKAKSVQYTKFFKSVLSKK